MSDGGEGAGRRAGCLSELALDRLLRGESAGAVAEAARAHVAGCERCRGRLADIAAARDAFRADPPPLRQPVPPSLSAAPSLPAPPSRWRRRRWPLAGGATVVAAAAALLFFVRSGDDADTRLKGGQPSVVLYVDHAHQLRRAAAGEPVAPGDTVQLTYSAARPFYGAILSRDGAGHVSRYFPDAPSAAALPAGRELRFPRATELDAVLGPESIFALFCDQAVALPPLEAALAAGRPLAAGDAPGCRIERLEIDKRQP
jgi:hypothetical protein